MKKFNKFNEVFYLIMEQIESASDDVYSNIISMFEANFKPWGADPIPEETAREIAGKAIEASKEEFSRAYDSDEMLDDAWIVKLADEKNPHVVVGNVTVLGYDQGTGEVTFKYGRTNFSNIKQLLANNGMSPDTEIKLKVGDILSLAGVKCIQDECKAWQRENRAGKEAAKKQADAEMKEKAAAAMKIPGFKEFLNTANDNRLTNEQFDELFQKQPKEIREGYIAYLTAKPVGDPNLMYADGPAYYQQLERDEDAKNRKEARITHLKTLL